MHMKPYENLCKGKYGKLLSKNVAPCLLYFECSNNTHQSYRPILIYLSTGIVLQFARKDLIERWEWYCFFLFPFQLNKNKYVLRYSQEMCTLLMHGLAMPVSCSIAWQLDVLNSLTCSKFVQNIGSKLDHSFYFNLKFTACIQHLNEYLANIKCCTPVCIRNFVRIYSRWNRKIYHQKVACSEFPTLLDDDITQ